MREATHFSRILEMKLRFDIGQKLLRSSVDRDGFREDAGQVLVWMTMNKFLQIKRDWQLSVVMIGTSSLKQRFQKVSWDGIKRTLFIFRSRNEFVNFGESYSSMWQEAEQVENQMAKSWCGYVQFCLWKSQIMCWQGRMHAFGDSGSELEGFRWRIVLSDFHSVLVTTCHRWHHYRTVLSLSYSILFQYLSYKLNI